MTHDPMCYFYSEDGRFDSVCNNCRLIAKVRADQRECCVAVIEEAAKNTSDPQLLIAAILEKS